ncbi:hypothetical protein HXX76_016223 [Chlamydomonas incerta]|uniref:Protein kinase domain-containing protein n=1 Tax=Chlamydomonas incerta TaxID=51695 RepID=A0A835S8C0_CHLIN|nr:hypothetical protein HXX76_016223 [Chlamydomonas incerta]|eukprot:KAG2422184.1 hypothetical protein HXX76_016223 [Chlamydomonas incerta]
MLALRVICVLLPASVAAADVDGLLHQAVCAKAPALRQVPGPGPLPLPADVAADAAAYGSTHFAALPLRSGERLLAVLWIAAGGQGDGGGPGAALPLLADVGSMRSLCNSLAMCLAGAVDPEYAAWLSGAMRRLAAAATLQALVGELCEAVTQHLRRRFFLDAVAHAAVVPEPRAAVGYMLDHRPQPMGAGGWGSVGPGGAARWGALMAGKPGGGGGGGLTPSLGVMGPGALGVGSPAGALGAFAAPGGVGGGGGGPGAGGGGGAAMAARLAGFASNAGGGGAPGAASAAAMVLPSLRAKGFQMSHTLLQRMVASAAAAAAGGEGGGGVGPDGVYAGVAVADCARHVQDVHQPSRDVCMLMAGGVRGADLTTDASDSNLFASERSTGRISMQSLVVLGLDVGQPSTAGGGGGGDGGGGGAPGSPTSAGGAAGGGGGGPPGSILALYLAFPTRLPPLLVTSTHASCRQLLSVMLARLVRRKVATELAAEFHTLCAGVPGSYAVVPSAPPASAAAAGLSRQQSQLGGDGTHGGRGGAAAAAVAAAAKAAGGGAAAVPLEPSIGSVGPGGSRRLPALAAANLLAAFTDAGCKPGAAAAAGGDKSLGVRPGGVVPPGDKSIGARPLPPGDKSLGPRGPLLLAGAAAAGNAGGGMSGRVIPLGDGSGRPGAVSPAVINGTAVLSLMQEANASTATAGTAGTGTGTGTGAGGVDTAATHAAVDEADVMLSSDPRGEEEEAEEAAAAAAAAAELEGGGGGGGAGGGGGEEGGGEAAPAAVLVVTEADGASSMRHHMGLLVESLMCTLRVSADDAYDGALAGARRGSLDLELDDLRLSGVLGDGGSGVVLCGMLGTVPVAVKIIQMPEVDQLLLLTPGAGGGGGAKAAAAAGAGAGAGAGNGAAPAAAAAAAAAAAHPAAANGAAGAPKPPAASGGEAGGGGGGKPGGNGGGAASSSKLHQAQRDMLRNAMELAVMRSISHVNIVQVYAVYDNVVLERLKREGGAIAYALRRQGPGDMVLPALQAADKPGASKPVFVALCMELCDSGSLASKLEERSFPRVLQVAQPEVPGPEPAAAVAGARSRGTRVLDMVGIYLTVLEVASALRYLHTRRLLHRDIKSANILLKASPTDPRGWTCKLADFGSAIVLDQYQPPEEPSQGPNGEMVAGGGGEAAGGGGGGGGGGGSPGCWYTVQEQSWGTITHMSPESMDNNSRVDASSDIFALGIVMWEIASGRGYRPYKELAPEHIGAAVRKGLRPAFTGEVPPAYRALAQACWAAEPHRRPSAQYVVTQIKAQLRALQSETRQQQQAAVALPQQQPQQQPPRAP